MTARSPRRSDREPEFNSATPPKGEPAGTPVPSGYTEAIEPAALAGQSYGSDVLAEMYGVAKDLFEAQQELEDRLTLRDVVRDPQSYSVAEPGMMGLTNIRGIGIGFKRENNEWRPTPCVKVYVREKVWEKQVADGMIPPDIGGVPTDVEEAPSAVAYGFPGREPRPVKCGCSIGPAGSMYGGTLGTLVLRGGKPMILSNNHVLAEENTVPKGAVIVQPGAGRNPQDWVGYLEDFVPLQAGALNRVDCAIAHTNTSFVSPSHHNYRISTTPIDAYLGMTVKKEGSRTGATTGTVMAVNVTRTNIKYRFVGYIGFDRVIIINGIQTSFFSQPGDSGSLVVEASSNRPVGLLFGGGGVETYANPISEVMTALQLDGFI